MSKIAELNSFSNKFYTIKQRDDDTTSIVVKKSPDTVLTTVLTEKGIVLPSHIVAYSKLAHSLMEANKKVLRVQFPVLNEVIVSNDNAFDKFRKNVGMLLLQLRENQSTVLYAPNAKCYHLIDSPIFNQFENLNPTAWVLGFYFRNIFGDDPSISPVPSAEEVAPVDESKYDQAFSDPSGKNMDKWQEEQLAQYFNQGESDDYDDLFY